jgi:hypothetical protein
VAVAAGANDVLVRADGSVLIRGVVSTVKAGDLLLLLAKGWSGAATGYALATAQGVDQEKDPDGKANTRITLQFTQPAAGPPAGLKATDYRLLKSGQAVHVWQYPTGSTAVITTNQVDLDAVIRQIQVGDPVLFDSTGTAASFATAAAPSVLGARRLTGPGAVLRRGKAFTIRSAVRPPGIIRHPIFLPPALELVQVTSYTEVLWFANPDGPAYDPTKPPAATNIPAIPIPHTRLGFHPVASGLLDFYRDSVLVRCAWKDVGELIATPAASVDGTNATLSAGAAVAPVPANTQVLVEDRQGNGDYAVWNSPAEVQLAAPVPALKPPLRALYNLLAVSRGQTVSEVLGSGNAGVAYQEFVLQKSPLTYLLSGDSRSGDGYSSTLRVWVDGIEWQEVRSFYGQAPDARVFVTREDEQGKTHVLGGDNSNGSRFPTGVNNVVARYRYGSGRDAPTAGSLTVLLQPWPNLTAVRNPVAVGGGADPDPPSHVRTYAPRSVLTFGRAVSADDYEVIAAQAPGVARARSYWAWDADEQRTLVTVYVGDDDGARQAAQTALDDADDPNRPVRVRLATAVPVSLSLAVLIDPARDVATVVQAVRAALLDPDTGLFGSGVVGIGRSVYESQVFDACLSVPGTRAVHGLQFAVWQAGAWIPETGYRHDPGEGGFYQLLDDDLGVTGYAP